MNVIINQEYYFIHLQLVQIKLHFNSNIKQFSCFSKFMNLMLLDMLLTVGTVLIQ
jgi:hypothetical protein